MGALDFVVVVARSRRGVVLVYNRYRHVWELPGGLIDTGESPGDAALRELAEEAGCVPHGVEWLGVVEVDDGGTHFGAVFACDVQNVPATIDTAEIGGVTFWRSDGRPHPLARCDEALLEALDVRPA